MPFLTPRRRGNGGPLEIRFRPLLRSHDVGVGRALVLVVHRGDADEGEELARPFPRERVGRNLVRRLEPVEDLLHRGALLLLREALVELPNRGLQAAHVEDELPALGHELRLLLARHRLPLARAMVAAPLKLSRSKGKGSWPWPASHAPWRISSGWLGPLRSPRAPGRSWSRTVRRSPCSTSEERSTPSRTRASTAAVRSRRATSTGRRSPVPGTAGSTTSG